MQKIGLSRWVDARLGRQAKAEPGAAPAFQPVMKPGATTRRVRSSAHTPMAGNLSPHAFDAGVVAPDCCLWLFFGEQHQVVMDGKPDDCVPLLHRLF